MSVGRSRRQSAAGLPQGVNLLTPADKYYPPLLREIYDPPQCLYVRGDPAALNRPLLAVVGSRKASPVALRLTEILCRQAVEAGLAVCSGLAMGVDGAAHRGALAAGGHSVAVMATGIDSVYPARHRQLAADLEQNGCLVTEFPPGTPPARHNFPRRNRIISGLSLGVLVVEAALRSGSLITARAALEQGREVFALPWSAVHEGGLGCLQLIHDGAKMVLSAEDVLEELLSLYRLQMEWSEPLSLAQKGDAGDSPVLQWLGCDVMSLDDLVAFSGWPVARLMSELSSLEVEGRVARYAGGYVRC